MVVIAIITVCLGLLHDALLSEVRIETGYNRPQLAFTMTHFNRDGKHIMLVLHAVEFHEKGWKSNHLKVKHDH